MSNERKPNIVFMMSDDHAAQAISCYNSNLNHTPNIDRIAEEGARFDRVYCTNSLCAPSRATILTGNYSHINGVRGLADDFDGNQQTFPKLMQESGYQTAIVGKWHLGHGGVHDPTGFDYWDVLPDQGDYYNPEMIKEGKHYQTEGYVSDVLTDHALNWLKNRDEDKPFMLMLHHKAPHRPWDPPERYQDLYDDVSFPEPESFYDQYENRARAAKMANMRIEDLTDRDVKETPPEDLTTTELRSWKYQRYIKDYLRCVKTIDDSVGAVLDYLEEENLVDNTIVVYTSDQGFFLGEHGWYDKRFMYEESLQMPFVMKYPKKIKPNTVSDKMIINNDFAPTFLDFAGVEAKENMQGESFRKICEGENPTDWREYVYYRYWEHLKEHGVVAHYGIRSENYKLIYYYGDPLDVKEAVQEKTEPEWELFDLANDPLEMNNVYEVEAYAGIVDHLKEELKHLRAYYKEEQ